MQSSSASLAVGLNCPVSMELMVLRETPTIWANCAWDSFFSLRASRSRFLSISSFSIRYTIAMEAMSSTSATTPQSSPYNISSHSLTLYHWYRYTAAIMEQ